MNEMFHEVVPVILKHDDNNCMMQSIENRSPYLDKDLFEFMNTVPSEYLIENGYQKNILRHVSNKILINSVRLDRKKVGFNASIEEMVDVRDKKFIKKYIEKNEFINDILDKKKLIDILNHTKINDELNKMLFAIISSYTFLELN